MSYVTVQYFEGLGGSEIIQFSERWGFFKIFIIFSVICFNCNAQITREDSKVISNESIINT